MTRIEMQTEMLNFQSRVKQPTKESPTLRSRLAGTAPPTHTHTVVERLNLSAEFLSIVQGNPSSRLKSVSDNESIIELAGMLLLTKKMTLAHLSDAFAAAGQQLRCSTVASIDEVHKGLRTKIHEFSQMFSETLNDAHVLYANMSRPFADTMCDLETRPYATFASQLSALDAQFHEAGREIDSLFEE